MGSVQEVPAAPKSPLSANRGNSSASHAEPQLSPHSRQQQQQQQESPPPQPQPSPHGRQQQESPLLQPPLSAPQEESDAAAAAAAAAASGEDEQRLDMLKRTALLVSTNIVNNVNYLVVELQASTRTPESILHIARIASLARKLMEGLTLPAEWPQLVAPPAAYMVQSERDLQTLFALCMTVFEELKRFVFDLRTELQQCASVADAVTLSTQISGFAKVCVLA